MNCPNCGRTFLEGGVPEFCPTCGAKIEGTEHFYGQGDFEDAPQSDAYSPFEDPGVGFFAGLWATTQAIFSSPGTFFRTMPPSGNLGKMILFVVLFSVVSGVFSGLYQVLFQSIIGDAMINLFAGPNMPPGFAAQFQAQMNAQNALTIPLSICGAPVQGVIGLFLVALIVHGMLILLGGASAGLEATIKVFAYTWPLTLLHLIPFLGAMVSGVWTLVVFIIGLMAVHGISAGKAVIAVLAPIAFCIVCLCAVYGSVILAAFGVMAEQGGF